MLKIFILSVAFIFVSCGDQSLPEANLAARSSDELTSNQDCQNVSFNQSPLEYNNTLKLFKCLSWSKAYPALFKKLQKIDQKDWNHLTNPINLKIFNDESKRVHFFSRVAALKIAGGFDQVDEFIKQLANHKPIISVILNKISELNSSEVEELFNTRNVSDENIQKILRILSKFDKYTKSQKDNLIEFINFYKDDEISQKTQVELINSLMHELNSKNTKYLLSKFKTINNKNQFSNLFKDKYLSRDNFEKLLLISKNYSRLDQGISYVDQYWEKHLICKNENKIRFGVEVPTIMQVFKEGNLNVVFDSMIDSQSKLLIFNEVCPLDNRDVINSMIDVHAAIIDLLSKESTFEFVSLLHKEFYDSANEKRLIKFFSSATFKKSTNLLDHHNKDKNLINILYEILNKNPDAVLNNVQDLAHQLEKFNGETKLEVIKKIWNKLNRVEQVAILELVKGAVKKGFSLEYLFNYWSLFFNDDLSLVAGVNENWWNDQSRSLISSTALLNVIADLRDEAVIADLIRFFNKDNLITVLKMFSSDISPIQIAFNLLQSTDEKNHLGTEQNKKTMASFNSHNLAQISCLKNLSVFQGRENGLTGALQIFHEVCPEMQSSSFFIPKINHSLAVNNLVMQNQYQADFLTDLGLFSKENVNLYLNLILKGNVAFQEMGGIKTVIQGANEVTEKKYLYNLIKPIISVAEIYLKNAKDNWLNEQTLTQLWKVLANSIKAWFEPIDFKLSTIQCTDYAQYEVTRIDCESVSSKYQTILKTLEVLGQKNSGTQLYKSISSLLDIDQGVQIPFGRKQQIEQSVDVYNILTLLYDLGSNETLKRVTIKDAQGVARVFDLNLLQRLEIVIRDISFMNNYYGSHFKNEVAAAKNYQNKVKKLFSQLKLMENSSRAMVKLGLLPIDSIYRLENIRETYSSLIEAGDTINNRNHAQSLQAIIAATVEATEERAQSFNPYRIPEPERTLNHKGRFLTYFSELNGMSSIAHILHKFYSDRADFEIMLKSNSFQKLNANLLKLASNNSLNQFLEVLTYKQLNRAEKISNRLIYELLKKFDELNHADSEKLLLATTNILLAVSEQLKPKSIDHLLDNSEFYLSLLVKVLESMDTNLDSNVIDVVYRLSQQLKDDKTIIVKLFKLVDVVNLSVSELNPNERNQLIDVLSKEISRALSTFGAISDDYDLELIKNIFNKLDEVFVKQKILDNLAPIIKKISHSNLYKMTQFLNEKDANRLNDVLDYLFVDSLDQINQMIDTTLLSVE